MSRGLGLVGTASVPEGYNPSTKETVPHTPSVGRNKPLIYFHGLLFHRLLF